MGRSSTARALFTLFLLAPSLLAQRNLDTVQIRSVRVTDNISMLQGSGGNIGACWGENGIIVIDDQFAPLTKKINKALADLANSDAPVRFVLNTHWHADHTGGNENYGKAGAVIVAHENVRKRMSIEQFVEAFNRKTPASPKDAWPIVSFATDVTFHLNGDDIHVFHVDNAHTDGDVVVHFTKANVLHAGDLFPSESYPFIDISSGGSFDGIISAAEKMLSVCNDDTKIIPGHGSLAGTKDLGEYADMLKKVRTRIRELINAGKSLEEVKDAKPTAEFDTRWGQGGFMTPDTFTGIAYQSLKKK